jgi:hypothetical protein
MLYYRSLLCMVDSIIDKEGTCQKSGIYSLYIITVYHHCKLKLCMYLAQCLQVSCLEYLPADEQMMITLYQHDEVAIASVLLSFQMHHVCLL